MPTSLGHKFLKITLVLMKKHPDYESQVTSPPQASILAVRGQLRTSFIFDRGESVPGLWGQYHGETGEKGLSLGDEL